MIERKNLNFKVNLYFHLENKKTVFFQTQKQCLESAHTERRIRIHVSIKLLIGTTKPGVKSTGKHKYLPQNFQPIPTHFTATRKIKEHHKISYTGTGIILLKILTLVFQQ